MTETQKQQTGINIRYIIYFLISFHALLFITFYLSLSYYNRLGRDETLMIYFLNKLGLINAIKYYYLTAEGNFTSNIIYCIAFQYLKSFKSIFIFHFLFLTLLYASIYFLLHRLNKLHIISVNTAYQLLLPALIVSPFFMFNPIINEVWFWPTAMVVYQIPFIILFFALYFLLSPSTGGKIAAFFLFILFGGTKINYVLMVSSIAALYFIYTVISHKKVNRSLLVVLTGLLIGLTIYLVSPSNMIRIKGEAVSRNLNTMYSAINYNIRYILTDFISPMQLLRIILFMSPFLLIDLNLLKSNTRKYIKNVILIVMLLNMVLIIVNGAVYFIATGKGVIFVRVWTFNFFVLVITLAFFVYCAGIFFRKKIHSIKYEIIIVALLIYPIVSYVRDFATEVPKAKALAQSYDKRVQILESYEGKTVPGGVLYLEPLGEPGLLNCVELDSNPAFIDNKNTVARFGLKCDISVRNKKW